MNKQQKLKIALPILAVIMAFVWGPIIMGSGSKRNADKSRPSGNGGTVNQGNNRNVDLTNLAYVGKRKKARTSFEDWGRNPFVLTQAIKALTIEGILWDEQDPKAMINGYIVGVGDKVGSNTIINITPTSVTIKGDAGESVLNF